MSLDDARSLVLCAQGMPAPAVCAKCRQIPSAEGDSWCSGCSAWEFVGRELTSSWDSQGARLLASDILVGAARQVKALRSLSSGLVRESGASGSAGCGRAGPQGAEETRAPQRESLPRRRPLPASAPPPPTAKEEEPSDDFDEETEEESEKEEHRVTSPLVRGGRKRAPEPEGPPPSKESRGEHHREHRGGKHRDRPKERSDKKRRTGYRGGRKHQRLHRLSSDPFLKVHRKPPSSFWELPTHGREHLEEGHLGR